jgi:hypothetical protein
MQTNPLGQVLKAKSPWTAIIIALLCVYVLITQNAPAKTPDVGARLARVEAVIEKLESLPLNVAIQTEAISNLKSSVDSLGRKIDGHISRDVK